MRLSRLCSIVLVLLSSLLLPVGSACAKGDEIVFGSVAMDIPAVMHKRLQPLVRYLSETLHRPVRLQLSPDMKTAIKEAAQGTVDLTYLTPVAYIKARESGDVQLVAKTVTSGRGYFRLMIVVKETSPVQKVEQLKGKRFAFGDPSALLQRAVVAGAGLSISDFDDVRYLGHYDNIVRAVINQDFDAGILKDTMAYKWQGKGIRIIYASPELPPYSIVACGKMPPDLLASIRQAFLQLNSESPAYYNIIKSLDRNYDGFMIANDREYDLVRKMIAPYAQDRVED